MINILIQEKFKHKAQILNDIDLGIKSSYDIRGLIIICNGNYNAWYIVLQTLKPFHPFNVFNLFFCIRAARVTDIRHDQITIQEGST